MNTPKQHRDWIFGIRGRVAGAALALAIVLVPAIVAITSAQAQTYTYSVLHSFGPLYGEDGLGPWGGLAWDAQGDLYGTTRDGGAYGAGTVFMLNTTGKETVLYSFTGGGDGAWPKGGVVLDAQDNLYSTTQLGGAYGAGTVFMLNTSGQETVLYSFTGGSDGAYPWAGLVMDAEGNLYGTTVNGGAYGNGTVFKVDMSGNETVLYSFGNSPDGASPYAGLAWDAQSNLNGTTTDGGAYGNGTVFKVDMSGNETVLYSFTGKGDGGQGFGAGSVVLDAQGNLYGTTEYGGAYNYGTVFMLDTTGKETVLHSFTDEGNGKGEGAYPYGGVVLDAQGDLYGTTFGKGFGTVFKLDTSGNETTLHVFSTYKGGYQPHAGVVLGAQGNLYGTTACGGAYGPGPYGTVFRLLSAAAATTTTLTSAPNPSTYGETVTFTAVVSAGAATDGETVTFIGKRKTVLGTGTLSGGSAIFTTSTLPVGTTAVTAVYGGDIHFGGSTSNKVKQVVKKAGE